MWDTKKRANKLPARIIMIDTEPEKIWVATTTNQQKHVSDTIASTSLNWNTKKDDCLITARQQPQDRNKKSVIVVKSKHYGEAQPHDNYGRPRPHTQQNSNQNEKEVAKHEPLRLSPEPTKAELPVINGQYWDVQNRTANKLPARTVMTGMHKQKRGPYQ